jgi:hypothetical protein
LPNIWIFNWGSNDGILVHGKESKKERGGSGSIFWPVISITGAATFDIFMKLGLFD